MERGVEHSLEERIGFTAVALGIYTLLCLFSPSTFIFIFIFLVVYSFISVS